MRVRRLTNRDAGRKDSMFDEGERDRIAAAFAKRFPNAIRIEVRWYEGPYGEIWHRHPDNNGVEFAAIVRRR